MSHMRDDRRATQLNECVSREVARRAPVHHLSMSAAASTAKSAQEGGTSVGRPEPSNLPASSANTRAWSCNCEATVWIYSRRHGHTCRICKDVRDLCTYQSKWSQDPISIGPMQTVGAAARPIKIAVDTHGQETHRQHAP